MKMGGRVLWKKRQDLSTALPADSIYHQVDQHFKHKTSLYTKTLSLFRGWRQRNDGRDAAAKAEPSTSGDQSRKCATLPRNCRLGKLCNDD